MLMHHNMDKINEVNHKQSLQKKLFSCYKNKFWHFCRKIDLCTFGIYVAKPIYALCAESFYAYKSVDRKVETFYASGRPPPHSKISKNISFLEASLMMVASKHNALKSSFSE